MMGMNDVAGFQFQPPVVLVPHFINDEASDYVRAARDVVVGHFLVRSMPVLFHLLVIRLFEYPVWEE